MKETENKYFNYAIDKSKWKFPRKYHNIPRLEFIEKEILKLKEGSKILNLGCGGGDNIRKSLYSKYNIYGIDICEEAIKYCKRSYGCEDNFKIGSAYKIPFKNKSFDMVIFVDVIEHLYHPSKALEEIKRVLKDDGTLIVITSNYSSIKWIIIENTWMRFFSGGCQPYKKDVHPSKFTEEMLYEYLKVYFKEVKMGTIFWDMGITTIARKEK